jgi:hypothetical protein
MTDTPSGRWGVAEQKSQLAHLDPVDDERATSEHHQQYHRQEPGC